ncbi:MAG: YwiC-like family protein [Holophagaceae bacterium]|nr:YwiC-like family protein [Holophagaceae bacterium]
MRRASSQIPAEHGSWAFLLLPTLVALALQPSAAGGWLTLASVAAFLGRVPLKRSWRAQRILPGDGFLLACEGLVGAGALGLALVRMPAAAVAIGALSLGPAAVIVALDLRGRSRTPWAETLSILAPCLFGGAVLAAGGGSFPQAGLLVTAAFLSLAVPVSYLRSVLARQRERAEAPPVLVLLAHGLAFAIACGLYAFAGIGLLWPLWMGALALRALAEPRLFTRLPNARSLGMREAVVCAVSAAAMILSLKGTTFPGP